jgi:murein L,D-transpeptidase YcbB/YkuD
MLKNISRFFVVITLLWSSMCSICLGVFPQELSGQVRELIRNRIEYSGIPFKIIIGKEVIYSTTLLPVFYEKRGYDPAWGGNYGPFSFVDSLLAEIKEANLEGLSAVDYHLDEIQSTLRKIRRTQQKQHRLNPYILVDLDLLLTDAFLIYASHLLAGKVNPEIIDAEWIAYRREADLAQLLESAVETGQIEKALKSLLPPQPGYKRLRDALARYRWIVSKGGWKPIPEGPPMKSGDQGTRVVLLCERLLATDDLTSMKTGIPDLYSNEVERAVRRFQERHGLEITGVVDSVTLAELNVTAAERIRQIELNMERWRWLPLHLGQRHILINIANFKLDVVENEQVILTMLAVVGNQFRRTPVFSDMLTYLVFNPYWNITPNMAIQDILPQVLKDPTYLENQRIKVLQGWGADASEVDPNSIDWAIVDRNNFPYRFRQEPGPLNALGRIKFMFPNKFNVYLHDTPSRGFFLKSRRDFSSGCIRIERPVELAEYLLREDPKWTKKEILATIESSKETTVKLPLAIPIHLLYWTAWADDYGMIHFRNDIYGRDKLVYEALLKKYTNSVDVVREK